MRFSVQNLLLVLAASNLPYQALSRALPQAGHDEHFETDVSGATFPKSNDVLSVTSHAYSTGAVFPRKPIDLLEPIEPVPAPKAGPEPVPESPKDPEEPVPEPLEPGAPKPTAVEPGPLEPGVTAHATADPGALDPETVRPSVTEPTASVKQSTEAHPTSKATASAPPEPTQPASPGTADCRRKRSGTGSGSDCVADDPNDPSGDNDAENPLDDEGGASSGDIADPPLAGATPDQSLKETGYERLQRTNGINNALKSLQQRIRTNAPDVVAEHNWDEAYVDSSADQEPEELIGSFPKFETEFADKDISIDDGPFTEIQIESKVAPKLGSDEARLPVSLNYISSKGDVLVCSESYRSMDGNWKPKNELADPSKAEPAVDGALTWSDLTFQRLRDITGGDPSKLTWIARANINNPGTIATAGQAYAKGIRGTTIATGQKAVWRASGGSTLEQQAFDALSMTDNVKGVNWMLSDHHTAFGDKTIQAIVTFYNGEGKGFDMYLKLGK